MSAILQSDAKLAINLESTGRGVRMLPMGTFTVQKVMNLDEFKSRKMDFRSLKPAVLVNHTLMVSSTTPQQ
jgi:hypothetical protein